MRMWRLCLLLVFAGVYSWRLTTTTVDPTTRSLKLFPPQVLRNIGELSKQCYALRQPSDFIDHIKADGLYRRRAIKYVFSNQSEDYDFNELEEVAKPIVSGKEYCLSEFYTYSKRLCSPYIYDPKKKLPPGYGHPPRPSRIDINHILLSCCNTTKIKCSCFFAFEQIDTPTFGLCRAYRAQPGFRLPFHSRVDCDLPPRKPKL